MALDRRAHAGGEALLERRHPLERRLREHVLERRAGGGERERVAGQRAADAAGVLVVALVVGVHAS